jgi:UDP-GlcNAc3NAcA epimerase
MVVKNQEQSLKIVTIVGARPQFVKAAVLSRVFAEHEIIDEIMVHTGQHYDANMSDVFFNELNIPKPKHFLNINNASHGRMTGEMLIAIEGILEDEKPDAVLVYGDTNSTLAGALAASKLGIKLIHVEAGLRSFNRTMPEEINRILTDTVSDLLLCPTTAAVDNLSNEGLNRGVVHCGDVMLDAVQYLHTIKDQVVKPDCMNKISSKNYGVMTIHRQASTASAVHLRAMVDYCHDYAKANDLQLIFPVHPRTKALMDGMASLYPLIHLVGPLAYLPFQSLLMDASVVMTDSGGLQKECYFHRVPCITLRDETEWIETIACGWNRFWTTPQWLPRQDIKDYGDGHAGSVICGEIIKMLEKKCHQIA